MLAFPPHSSGKHHPSRGWVLFTSCLSLLSLSASISCPSPQGHCTKTFQTATNQPCLSQGPFPSQLSSQFPLAPSRTFPNRDHQQNQGRKCHQDLPRAAEQLVSDGGQIAVEESPKLSPAVMENLPHPTEQRQSPIHGAGNKSG